MLPLVRQIAIEYKSGLQNLYGNDLAELILFGSHARGDFHNESDIDFALVLRRAAICPAVEILKVSPLSLQLELKYGVVLSTLPVSEQKKETSLQSVYRDIRKEGIPV
jgi:predicted nucleotidyltransferase